MKLKPIAQALALAGLTCCANTQAADYTFTDIGSQFWQPYSNPGPASGYSSSGFSSATHINNNGQVMLTVQMPYQMTTFYLNGTVEHANLGTSSQAYILENGQYSSPDQFRSMYKRETQPGVFDEIGYSPWKFTSVSGLNNSGAYVGTQSVEMYHDTFDSHSDFPGWHVVTSPVGGNVSNLWSYSTNCSSPCNDYTANGLNDAGQVVGSYNYYRVSNFGGTYDTRAYISNPGGASFLSNLAEVSASTAMAINNQGTVVGSGSGGVVGGTNALLWARPNATSAYRTYSLGTLVTAEALAAAAIQVPQDAITSTATGINDAGMVIGYSTGVDTYVTNGQTFYGINQHAFVWKDGVMQDLGAGTQVNDINNSGVVVGTGGVNGTTTAILWKNGVGVLDLNSMVDRSSGLTLLTANGINDQGEIVGQAQLANGVYTAYRLNPFGTGLSAMNPILQAGSSGSTFSFTAGNNLIDLSGNVRPGGWFDPMVAEGYVFSITSEGNAFTAAQVPFQYGDGNFQIEVFDETTGQFVSTGTTLTAGSWFEFASGGVQKFRITGIETSAYVDPNDPNGFVTGLTFLGNDAQFDMTAMQVFVAETNSLNLLQAPSTTPVPVPAAVWLFGSGLLGLIGVARRKHAA